MVVNVKGWTSTPRVAMTHVRNVNITGALRMSTPMYFFSNSPVKWRYVSVKIRRRLDSKVNAMGELYLDKGGFPSATITD